MSSPDTEPVPTVLTIGHSTHSIEAFISLLKLHGVRRLVDVRTIPRSRHNPQFSRDEMKSSLRRKRIGYKHLPELGGLRRPRKDSPNTGWRNLSFRGFADYMQTPEFEQGLQKLIEMTSRGRIAIMCAEAVPWRCHHSLIADALVARGVPVEDVIGGSRPKPHQITPFAKINKVRITYPAPD